MNGVRKYISILLAALVLTVSTGISFTRHICLANCVSPCSEDTSCCKTYKSENIKSSKCCLFKSVYIKADFVSSGERLSLKFFTWLQAGRALVCSPLITTGTIPEKRCHAPSPEKSNRTILLSTSKLSV